MTADAVGGVWTYAVELCRELNRCDVQVVLAVIGPPPSAAQRAQIAALAGVQLECADYKLEWMHDPWSDVERAGEWLLTLAAREKVDVIHLNGYSHAALPWGRPVLVVAHSCVCSWWRAVHGEAPPAAWDTYRRYVDAGVRAADHIVAPTRAFLEELRRWRRPTGSASVIYNGRAPEHVSPERAGAREPLIFACGRLWDEAKNMRTLDAAAQSLAWPVYVAGDPAAPDGVRFTARGLRLLGVLPPADVAAWLTRAAIYVHPASYEPFGLSVLEAALARCALVLADLPSLRELWGDAALFTPPNDADALRAMLEQLSARPALREQLAQAALRRAQQYTPEAMGREYRDLYTALRDRKRTQERAVA
jgi:glycosyltransferase involved in cell wall biosynthesis